MAGVEVDNLTFVAPSMYRDDHDHRVIDSCTLSHNADRVITGTVKSTEQILATDCTDGALRAPYRTVMLDTGDTLETLKFPEYHFVHRELQKDRRIHVGVREVDGLKFGMNYVFEVDDGPSAFDTRVRADVNLTRAQIDSLKASIADSGCPRGLSTDEFRTYVTNKVEQCSDLVPNEVEYEHATDLDEEDL